MKAQQVKNAVIVLVGAKGGFYPKQLPSPATGRLEPTGRSPADADLEGSEGLPRSPVGHTHWAPEERRDRDSYSELCTGPAILADA